MGGTMRTGVLTFGETLALFRARDIGAAATASDYRLSIGGAESNVAIGLSRLGTPCTWVGVIGDDPFGRRIERDLKAEGLRAEVRIDPTVATAVMARERRLPGTGRVAYYRTGSAGSRLHPDDIGRDLIAQHELLHVTGITLALSESARAAVLAAVGHARDLGVTVSFDINHRPSLWPAVDARPWYREVTQMADIVFAGRDEAALIVSDVDDDDELLKQVASLGPREVVLKDGAEAAIAWEGKQFASCKTHAIKTVDTVGAGDGFVAGYLSAVLEGEDLEARLARAMACGAFACLSDGDWEGAPTRAELTLLTDREPVSR
jgi:2-dehydro-3-deoxygluconokinase